MFYRNKSDANKFANYYEIEVDPVVKALASVVY